MKISSESENFERATHRGPIFGGEFGTSRSKFSSEIGNFERDLFFLIVGLSGPLVLTANGKVNAWEHLKGPPTPREDPASSEVAATGQLGGGMVHTVWIGGV